MQVWGVKGMKAAFVGSEASKHVTMLPVVSAAGTLLVMFFIIKGVRLMKKYCESWPDAVFLMTESGGIDNSCWPDIMQTIVDRAPKPCIILVDGHKVHCNNLAILNMCAEQNVQVVQGVPHSTHKTQPLDVGVFSAFNKEYDAKKSADMLVGMSPDPANSIVWARTAWDSITKNGVIAGAVNAFKKVGVYPYNPDALTADDYEPSELHGRIVGDAREAAGLPRSPEAIISEAFGPPLPPSMIKSAIERHSTMSTGSVLLTGAEHLTKMASDLFNKAQEDEEKKAAAAAKKEKKRQKDAEDEAKKAERVAKREAKAASEVSAAAAAAAKKRARSESEPPGAKSGKKRAAAVVHDEAEPAASRIEVRPGKRTRFLK